MDSFEQTRAAMETRGWRLLASLLPFLPGYALYCLCHLLVFPLLILRSAIRARQWSRGMMIARFLGGERVPPRPNAERPWTLIFSVALGETRTAVLAAEAITQEHDANIALMVARQESRRYLRSQALPFAEGVVPFNNPLSAFLLLLRWRPESIFFVEMTDNYHLCLWCLALGIKTVFLNVHIQQEETDRRRAAPRKLWRIRCAGAYAAQGETPRQRLLSLGVPDERIVVTGPCLTVPHRDGLKKMRITAKWSELFGLSPGERPIILAGSVYHEEELCLLDAFAGLREDFPDALLILAPRNLNRAGGVESALALRNLPFVRRSQLTGDALDAPVLLLDTVGELCEVYSMATVAFVGGSFMPEIGGHTPIEALVWGVPSTVGPHYDQQTALIDLLSEAGVTRVCANVEELRRVWGRLLEREPLRDHAFCASQRLVERYGGMYGRVYAELIA